LPWPAARITMLKPMGENGQSPVKNNAYSVYAKPCQVERQTARLLI
jgi:hypothetical protein